MDFGKGSNWLPYTLEMAHPGAKTRIFKVRLLSAQGIVSTSLQLQGMGMGMDEAEAEAGEKRGNALLVC